MDENKRIENVKNTLQAGSTKIVTTLCSEDVSNIKSDNSTHLHNHPRREMCFILQGNTEFTINGMLYNAEPGTVFLLNKFENHDNGYNPAHENIMQLWFSFYDTTTTSRMVCTDLDQTEVIEVGKDLKLNTEFSVLLNKRWDILESLSPCSSSTKDFLLKSLINSMIEEVVLLQFNMVNYAPEYVHDIPVFVYNYIKNANGWSCSLSRLEKVTGYSRFYLAKCFKKRYGITIGDHINKVRMDFAEDALKNKAKQKTIAVELGFASASTFWHWFNREKKKQNNLK